MENKIKNIVLLLWAGGLGRGRIAEKVGQMTVSVQLCRLFGRKWNSLYFNIFASMSNKKRKLFMNYNEWNVC